ASRALPRRRAGARVDRRAPLPPPAHQARGTGAHPSVPAHAARRHAHPPRRGPALGSCRARAPELPLPRGAQRVRTRHVTRDGARDVRMLGTALGAESYGSTVFSTEHENYAAFGAFYDKIMNDEELLSLMHQAEGPNSPYVTTMLTTAIELPLGRKRAAKHGR